MSLLYIECNAGVAGDMLCAALLDLLPEQEAAEALQTMNGLPLPDVSLARERAFTCGIAGTRVRVTIAGVEEGERERHEHGHGRTHGHDGHDSEHVGQHTRNEAGHAHVHRSLSDIEALINSFDALPEAVRENARAVYRLIAEAEAAAHGSAIDHIHFHEVGTLDAVADVTFACLLMARIQPDQVIVSPVRTGFGEVRCAHGTLPVPAPATAQLLQGIPSYAGEVEGEFCTPTGAALVRRFATGFSAQPPMSTEHIGYGIGTKEFPIANCVRAFLGEPIGSPLSRTGTGDAGSDDVVELCCNIDDMTAEDIAFTCERLMEAGALDAFTIALGMKKNRPGTMICALCEPDRASAIERVLFLHTTTLGVRRRRWQRSTLQRETRTVETALGPVRQKVARSADRSIERAKWEHDDLVRLAREHGMTLAEVRQKLGRP